MTAASDPGSPLSSMNPFRPALRPGEGLTGGRRLAVVGAGGAQVVCAAGGFLYDHSTAGWSITVYLPERCDERAFRILGTQTAFLDGNDISTGPRWPAAVLASSALRGVDDADTCRIEHRLSAAARAFKAQALIALGLRRTPLERVETFLGDAAHFTVSTARR